MMGEGDFQHRLAGLRTRFVARSRQDRAYLEKALAAFAQGDESEVEEMRRVAHVLAGTAGTFGFAQLGAAADEFEASLLSAEADRNVTLTAGRNVLAELAEIEGSE